MHSIYQIFRKGCCFTNDSNHFLGCFYFAIHIFIFLDRSVIRRYISVALFVTVINVILYEIA